MPVSSDGSARRGAGGETRAAGHARIVAVALLAAAPFALACLVIAGDAAARERLFAHLPALLLCAAGAAFLIHRLLRRPPADAAAEGAGYAPDAAVVARLRGELDDRTEELREIVEAMPYACMINNADYRVTSWNPAAERLFGWSRAEMLGQNSIELIVPPGARAGVYTLFGELAGGGPVRESPNPNLRRDGSLIQCEWSNARLTAADGRFIGFLSMAVDVTKRLAAERALRESEARFRQLTALSSDWYWEQDEEFRFVATEQADTRLDRPVGESVGLRRWERPGSRPVGTTWEAHRRVLEAHQPFSDLLLEFSGVDGLIRYVEVRGEPIFDAAGRFTGYRGVGADISARHRHDILRAGERRLYDEFAAGAPLVELMELLCRTVETALARPGCASVMVMEDGVLRKIAAPGMPAPGVAALAAGIVPGPAAGSCGTAAYRKTTVVCPDLAGDPLWEDYREVARACGFASSWSTPVTDTGGAVLATVAVYCTSAGTPVEVDIELTRRMADLAGVLIERFRAESARRDSDARYRSLVELSQEGVLIHEDGIVRYANPALARMLKATSVGQIVGTSIFERLDAESRDAAQRRRRRIVDMGQTVSYTDLRIRCFDGSVLDAEAAGGPVELEGRRMVQSYVRDISARKWAELEMRRLNESLEQRVAERTAELTVAVGEIEAFSYTVAHDLRAPLRAIDGYARMLGLEHGEALGEGGRRDLDMVVGSAQRMAELIDGLLEFSRLSRGSASYQHVPTRALVEAAVVEAGQAFAHRPAVEIGVLPDVFGDPGMLRQVWQNLIFNAFKFTARVPAPQIRIDCRLADGAAVFSVGDNGAGFDSAYAGKLFGMFQRLHSRAEFEGTGVGLAIVKRIVERHHGRVEAEGSAGHGAVFRFSLPETSVAAQIMPVPASPPPAGGGDPTAQTGDFG